MTIVCNIVSMTLNFFGGPYKDYVLVINNWILAFIQLWYKFQSCIWIELQNILENQSCNYWIRGVVINASKQTRYPKLESLFSFICLLVSCQNSQNFKYFLARKWRDFSKKVQCWSKKTLQVLFYEAKVPTSDGYSTI